MVVMHYQTQDGLAHYGFSIEYQSDMGWRVYIIFNPLCKGGNDISKVPYQSIDDGRRYVDWPSRLDSLGDAKTVAELWAEITLRHQRAQEEHDLYVELIQHHKCTHEQRVRDKEATNSTNSSDQSSIDAA